ncbi:MAG: endonuclease/exonuclease/phosphatase family protein [Planctomycetota bacterium]|nr:endonuclease/exonuclease/phosphatase family protein [Planctomycetota bacterium]
MRRHACACSLLVLVLATACAPEDAEQPADLRLEVMSFNIRWDVPGRDGANEWARRRTQVYELLRDPDLDVVGLQEATPGQLADIRAAVPALEAHSADPVMNGIAILYRRDRFRLAQSGAFWFSPTPDVPESRDWSSATRRHVCAWVRLVDKESGRAFYLYDLHLDLNAASRRKSVVLLGERIAARTPKDPVIVVGDFNAAEAAAPSRYLRGEIELGRRIPEPLVDTFRVVDPDARNVGTGNGFRGRTTGAKIDYIYVEPGTAVLAAAIDRRHVDGAYPSDHFPVTATIVLDD